MIEERTYVILIVDDDENFRRGLKRQFGLMKTDFAFEILESSSGAEAVAVLKERQIDCVLIDYNMPGGSGLEWLSRIFEINSEQAVIMITGVGSEEIAVEAMKHGIMDYLVKGSIASESLERAIVNTIEKINMRKTIARQQEQLIEAERQRVMIESLGAACHHVSQPVTVINAYLELMKRQEKSEQLQEMIDSCMKAAEEVGRVLDRLREVSTYRTTSYLPAGDGAKRCDENIIDVSPFSSKA